MEYLPERANQDHQSQYQNSPDITGKKTDSNHLHFLSSKVDIEDHTGDIGRQDQNG